jgi:hypothetical protein
MFVENRITKTSPEVGIQTKSKTHKIRLAGNDSWQMKANRFACF